MTSHAEGTFTVKAWDESPFQEMADGTKLTKAEMTFDFGGDVTGEGVSDTVMYYRADGTAVYTGLQRMVGHLAGRDGSFVLLADGEYAAGEARTRWQVIEGSGTGRTGRLARQRLGGRRQRPRRLLQPGLRPRLATTSAKAGRT